MRSFIIILTIAAAFSTTVQAQLKVVPLSKNLSVVEGSGGNSGLLVTDKAVVIIDTKMASGAAELSKMVMEKAEGKPIIVINTHYHGDHVTGNHFYKDSKKYIGAYDQEMLKKEVEAEDMPTDFVTDSLVLDLGNETVVMYNMGQAHTWKDMVVLLKKNKVMFTGDLIFYKVNPFVIAESGANVNNWMADLDKILKRNDYTTLVPGHGDPGGKEIASSIKQYFTDMKTAAKDPSKQKEIVEKYSSWAVTPGHASPEITIQYIKTH